MEIKEIPLAPSERALSEMIPASLTMRELIQALFSSEPVARQQACPDLVAVGWRAFRPLLEAPACFSSFHPLSERQTRRFAQTEKR